MKTQATKFQPAESANIIYDTKWYAQYDAAPPLDQFRKAAEFNIFKNFIKDHSPEGESLYGVSLTATLVLPKSRRI